jgi:predicted amidophosphoribosyltransferase
MALCTSCGNQVEESASFCTSCGKPMPAAAQPSAAVTVARPVCPSCGAQADPGSVFCTGCGKRLDAEPEPVAKGVPTVVAAAPPSAETAAPTASPSPFCTSCGTELEPGTGFCTNCGQPVGNATASVSQPPIAAAPAISTAEVMLTKSAETVTSQSVADPAPTKAPAEPTIIAPAPAPFETAAAEPSIDHEALGPAPQVAAPLYATPSDYPPAQPAGGGAFRVIVLVLLLVIVIGGLGGWYFMGTETVIVCSPPDVTVFLDDKELAPTSYGRYVIPHLSRQPHLLRVQRAGFADTIERLDFPMMSLHEWVNIKLVPRRQTRPSSSR